MIVGHIWVWCHFFRLETIPDFDDFVLSPLPDTFLHTSSPNIPPPNSKIMISFVIAF